MRRLWLLQEDFPAGVPVAPCLFMLFLAVAADLLTVADLSISSF